VRADDFLIGAQATIPTDGVTVRMGFSKTCARQPRFFKETECFAG
jgi:hypothetical protein